MSFSTRMRVSLGVVGVLNGVSRDCITNRMLKVISYILRFFSCGRRAANKRRPHLSELPRRLSQQCQPCPKNWGSWGQNHLDALHWGHWHWTKHWLGRSHWEWWHMPSFMHPLGNPVWRLGNEGSALCQQHKHCWSSLPHRWQCYWQRLEAGMGGVWKKSWLCVL